MDRALKASALASLLLLLGLAVSTAWLLRDRGETSAESEGSERAESRGRGRVGVRGDIFRRGTLDGEDAPTIRVDAPIATMSGGRDRTPPAGSVAGRLRAGPENEPLAASDVRVRIDREGRSSIRRVKTGEGGEFRLDGLDSGDVELTFEHDAFRPTTVRTTVLLGDARKIAGELDVVLVAGYALRGIVRDLRGQPASGVLLEWYHADGGRGGAPREVATDRAGRYEIGGLREGSYVVRAMPERLRALWDGPPTRRVAVRRELDGEHDLTVDVGGTLPVVVTRADGAHAAGVEVRFVLKTRRRGLSGTLRPTDGRGRTELRGLPHAGILTLEIGGDASRETGGAVLRVELESLPRVAVLEVSDG